MLIHIHGIQKNSTDEPICKTEIEKQTQRMDIWIPGWEGGVGMNWEIGIDIVNIYTTMHKTDTQ